MSEKNGTTKTEKPKAQLVEEIRRGKRCMTCHMEFPIAWGAPTMCFTCYDDNGIAKVAP